MEGNTTGSAGGSAIATLNLTAPGGIIGTAEADGGAAGGPVFSAGPPVTGADATAMAQGILTSNADSGMQITALAIGGAGYPAFTGFLGNRGAALARASGTETFSHSGEPIGNVNATASSGGAFFIGINGLAASPVNGVTITWKLAPPSNVRFQQRH